MKRLWVRLTLAFVAVTALGVGVFAALASWSATTAFRNYVARQEMFLSSGELETLSAYFAEHGGWEGVGAILPQPGGNGRGQGRNRPTLLIADVNRQVVFDEAELRPGSPLTADEQDRATPITDGRGAVIGYLVFNAQGGGQALTATQQSFLTQLQWALGLAGGAAALAGIILGIVISRSLAAPLAQTASAARGFAARDWSQRAPVAGAEEVADVARSFNAMADELQAAEVTRRSLMADIAHELRTPLSVMQGNLRAILDGVYPLEVAEIANLYDETRLLSRLVEDLRELALAEAGRPSLHPQRLDLSAILNQTAAQFAAAADAQGVTLRVTPGVASAVKGDPDRVAQVLRNLVANALRHTPSEGSIALSSAAQPGFMRVTVADTGEGIAREDQGHVFDRFYRVDRSRARASGGSGLGLAIARAWVEAMGGRIGVESAPGAGSRFWFELPMAD